MELGQGQQKPRSEMSTVVYYSTRVWCKKTWLGLIWQLVAMHRILKIWMKTLFELFEVNVSVDNDWH